MNKVTENLILDIDDIRNLFGNLDSNIDFISLYLSKVTLARDSLLIFLISPANTFPGPIS